MNIGTLIVIVFTRLCFANNCNPLKDHQCFVQNNALNSEATSISPTQFDMFDNVTQSEGVLTMTINKRFDNPRIESKFSILYGKVECEIKAAKGQGIISSVYLQSNDLDEIDIAEMFGGNRYQFQTNFFIKGNTSTWDRGQYHSIANPLETFNKYTVEWTPHEILWFVNDQLVRRVPKQNYYGIPKSPMRVKFSLWAGGDAGNEEGTILWAGGQTEYDKLPYTMEIQKVYVTDYSSGAFYNYGHKERRWVQLYSVNGSIGGRVGEYEVEPEEFTELEKDAIFDEREDSDERADEEEDNELELEEMDRNNLNRLYASPGESTVGSLTRVMVWFVVVVVVFVIWV